MDDMGGQDGHGENVRESLKPVHRVGQPQMLFSGVAQPIETASRLIAVVQLYNGFPLMLGVATPKVARSRGDGHDRAVGWLE